MESYDVVIIGSGPAGISSAIALQKNGLKIALLDESSTLGGQIYRSVEKNAKHKEYFDDLYLNGLKLINQLCLDEIRYINNAVIWNISKTLEIFYLKDDISHIIKSKKIIIAVGAYERPMPVTGWTLPGVIGASSAQIMFKESLVVKDDAVFVGSGPLFYYIIAQYLEFGAKIKAIVDTTPLSNYFKAFKYLPKAMLKLNILLKGLFLFLKFKKHNVKIYNLVDKVSFVGDNELKNITIEQKNKITRIDTKIAFIHNGLIPNINLQLQVGCEYEFCQKTRTITIKTDKSMKSSVENIYVVGDGKLVRGAEIAIVEAKIASINILKDFDKVKNIDKELQSYKKDFNFHISIRDFIDTLYLPTDNFLTPTKDDDIVCRCEEVTLKDIKHSIDLGCKDANSIKSFTRCGMGNCQSRFCSLSLLEILAKQSNIPIEQLKHLRIRSPIKPIKIKQMAKIKL